MNPKKLLDDILAVQQGDLATDSQLPPLAATWTSETDDVTHVLATFRDLQISEQQMKSSLELVEKLDRILNRDHPEEFFVTLRDGVQRAREIEKRLLALEKAKLSLMTEEITGGMGTGGKATIVFKNELGKEYVLKKAVIILDGKELTSTLPLDGFGSSDEGTILIQGPIALGSHRLQVSLNFEGDGGLFDYVKSYRFNMKDELAFVSKGAQESKIVIAAYKRGDFTVSFEKRPHLKFDGDYSQGVALNLSSKDLKKLERLRKEREVLENKLAMIDNMGSGIKRSKAETEKYIGMTCKSIRNELN